MGWHYFISTRFDRLKFPLIKSSDACARVWDFGANLPRCRSCIDFGPWKASLAKCQRRSLLRWRLMYGRHPLLAKWTFSRWCQTFQCSWLSSYWTLTLWWCDCARCRNYFGKTCCKNEKNQNPIFDYCTPFSFTEFEKIHVNTIFHSSIVYFHVGWIMM